MVTADSSVWIDYFNGADTPKTTALDTILSASTQELILLDIVLMEVLRGFKDEQEYQTAYRLLLHFAVQPTGGKDLAIASAQMYRQLRKKGVTVRSSIDLLVATWCITHQCDLIHHDHDFDGIALHYPLHVVGEM